MSVVEVPHQQHIRLRHVSSGCYLYSSVTGEKVFIDKPCSLAFREDRSYIVKGKTEAAEVLWIANVLSTSVHEFVEEGGKRRILLQPAQGVSRWLDADLQHVTTVRFACILGEETLHLSVYQHRIPHTETWHFVTLPRLVHHLFGQNPKRFICKRLQMWNSRLQRLLNRSAEQFYRRASQGRSQDGIPASSPVEELPSIGLAFLPVWLASLCFSAQANSVIGSSSSTGRPGQLLHCLLDTLLNEVSWSIRCPELCLEWRVEGAQVQASIHPRMIADPSKRSVWQRLSRCLSEQSTPLAKIVLELVQTQSLERHTPNFKKQAAFILHVITMQTGFVLDLGMEKHCGRDLSDLPLMSGRGRSAKIESQVKHDLVQAVQGTAAGVRGKRAFMAGIGHLMKKRRLSCGGASEHVLSEHAATSLDHFTTSSYLAAVRLFGQQVTCLAVSFDGCTVAGQELLSFAVTDPHSELACFLPPQVAGGCRASLSF